MSASPYLGEFLALAGVHFLAVMSPGPDFAVTVSQSVRHGRKTGLLTALGIGAGISVHVLYTLLGVGALMHASPWISRGARLLGGAYLVYLGVKLLLARPAAPASGNGEPATAAAGAASSPTPRQSFMTGFLTNATNPKATLFFLAIFTTIVSPGTPMLIQIGFGVWMCCTTALWFCLVSLLFSTARVRLQFERLGHWFERVMGALLLAFAVRLLWQR
ncbi:MAG: LysE family transporter [Burkholderiaceae bacterium]|jgi:RhtB (resistance to homoserine/threonine) family protein|nr:LysE family transporter [Burkholderiaceae bacterium]